MRFDKTNLIADISSKIYTNLQRLIKGNTVKDRLVNIVDSTFIRITDTASNFTINNPVLAEGEVGIETDSLLTSPKFKFGNGITSWNSLPYASSGSSLGFTPENLANKGISNGYAPLNSSTKIDPTYLPSYVDDVIEVANFAALPVTGETGKIYITIDTNAQYRWTGTVYAQITISSAVWGNISGVLSNQTDLQNALNALIGGSIFQTVWNANTNSPTLTSGVGTKGHYYIVTVEGGTALDGINDWKNGDWVIFDGESWRKVDNTDAIISFNGRLGAITPQSGDYTTAMVAATTDKNYVTNAQLTVLNNTSNSNTGDETTATIAAKSIDDSNVFLDKTYSSSKIESIKNEMYAMNLILS